MDEAQIHFYVTIALFVLAVPTLAILALTTAPYGRHNRAGWGPTISSRAGWILMEHPAVIVFSAVFFLGRHRFELVPLVFFAIWQAHYFHRTFVFPFRMRTEGKRMPVSIPLLGALFNATNAYVNARWISHFGAYDASWLADPRFIGGAALFTFGLVVNLHADTVLIHLRKPGETGYKIPRGGMYRFISSPNYFGEIVEWFAWALLTWSLSGLAFGVYTAANLGPRAFWNHAWYREKFPDYPKERRALVPFVM